MSDKYCVFVDGENFRHSLVELFSGEFDPDDYLPKNADWQEFFQYLVGLTHFMRVERFELLRTYWYVVQHVDFKPYNLPHPDANPERFLEIVQRDKGVRKEIAESSDSDRPARLINIYNRLKARERGFRERFQGWANVQDGIAGRQRSIEFRRAGSINYNLFQERLGPEKAVDVKLAVDLIVLRNIYEFAIIVSGDQDYVPAVQAIKDSGKRVINVSFLTRNGNVLPGGARRLNQITDGSIQVPYADMKDLLNIPSTTTPIR